MRKPLADINVTPLVDALLVLLVVLMLLMPLYVRRLPVELPRTGLAGAPVPVRTLQVTLDAAGRLSVAGHPAALPDVLAAVTSNTTVEVAADAAATYEQLARLIAALQQHGARDIVLATR